MVLRAIPVSCSAHYAALRLRYTGQRRLPLKKMGVLAIKFVMLHHGGRSRLAIHQEPKHTVVYYSLGHCGWKCLPNIIREPVLH